MRTWMRNGLLACLAACAAGFAALPSAYAAEPIKLRWEQLAPPPPDATQELLTKISAHRRLTQGVNACVKASTDLVSAYDGERVKIAGFVVPFNGDEGPLRRFVLIAAAGGCAGLPPRNQMILVSPKQSVVLDNFFYPVDVTGIIHVMPAQTFLGEVGYRLVAESVEPQ